MGERRFLPGKFTDLSDPRQLGMLNDLLTQILAVMNAFDQNSFALSWIEGDTDGQVIVSKGVGNAPEWSPTPTLTGATFTGLTGSRPVVTTAGKALSTIAYTGSTSLRNNLGLETDDSPTFTGVTVSELTANALVATDASKKLISDTTNYVIGVGTNTITVGDTEPVDPAVGDLWIDTSP